MCSACRSALAPGAKFCGECGAQTAANIAPPRDAKPDPGERRQLTVVFCDLVGSTELSGRLDPEEWRDLVAAYQEIAAAVVEKHGGHVAQYLGDGQLVYFGYPAAHDDDAERALRAALGIVEALQPLNAKLVADRQLAVRVGVHTGFVVVGQVGGGARRETLALGETTNVAARLQALAAPDTVVMSAATQRLVPGIFVVEDLGPKALKGVVDPVACMRVVQPSGMRSRLDVAADRLTRFVGREAEIGTLLHRWEQATEGQGQNVLVVGEAGVGKSRLAWELRARLAAEPHTWLECRATPYTQGTPLFPVVELMEQGLAFAPEDAVAEKIAKLERGLALLRDPLAETVPILAKLLDLPLPETYTPVAVGPDEERQRTLEILSAWSLAIGEVQPLVLLVEDLHWCDATSLALLGRVVEQSATAHVLFVGTARPEFTPPWPARSNTTTLSLARLTKRQARVMVTALAGSLAAETVEALVVRADGVPLYLEELTKTVAEPGAARDAEAIPATLADSLMARLDRLSTVKDVAQRASVLGREFAYASLARIADLEDAALQHGLARLVDAEILFVRGVPPHATYTFKHVLVQEAAYESLLKRVRQQLHERVCDALGVGAEPEVLAHHAERAGRIVQAIDHLERAGFAARGRSAHGEAVRHFERAIALLGTQPESAERDAAEARLQFALGNSAAASAGYGSSARYAAQERACTLSERIGDWQTWTFASVYVCSSETSMGNFERARELACRVIGESRADEAQRIYLASEQLMMVDFYQARFDSALRNAERALDAWSRWSWRGEAQDTDHLCVVYGFSAWTLGYIGRLDEALARAQDAVTRAEECGSPFDLAWALNYDIATRHVVGDLVGVRARCADVLAVSDRFGFPLWSGIARFYRAHSRVVLGDPDGLAEMMDGLARAGKTGTLCGSSAVLGMLADAQRRIGRLEKAQVTLAGAMAFASQTGERNWEPELNVTDAEIALAMGAPLEDVLARFRKALAIARELGAVRGELVAAMAMAETLRDAGYISDAHAKLAPVYAKFTQGFGTPLLMQAKRLLAQLGSSLWQTAVEVRTSDSERYVGPPVRKGG